VEVVQKLVKFLLSSLVFLLISSEQFSFHVLLPSAGACQCGQVTC